MDATARLLLDLGNLAGKHGYPQICFHYNGGEDNLFQPGWYAYAVHRDPLNVRGIHTKDGMKTPEEALAELQSLIVYMHGN
jgi:hypothetical protein